MEAPVVRTTDADAMKDRSSMLTVAHHGSLTAADAILSQLADSNRQALSDWRALVLLRRASRRLPASARRWTQMPQTVEDVHPLLAFMVQQGMLEPIDGVPHVYTTPMLPGCTYPAGPDEILLEAHPHAVLAFESALQRHFLTLRRWRHYQAYAPVGDVSTIFPLGTTAADWDGIEMVRGRRVDHIGTFPVQWTNAPQTPVYGMTAIRPEPENISFRITSYERSLLDTLLHPDDVGGFIHAMQAWGMGRHFLHMDPLLDLTECFASRTLERRVGFVLEEMGFHHARLDVWQARNHHGAPSYLYDGRSWESTFNARWNLHVNGQIEDLTYW